MPRRVSPAQIKSMVRKMETKQRQALSDLRKAERAIKKYDREARAQNARVRANQQRLQAEITRFNRQRSSTRFTSTQTSTVALHTAFTRVERTAEVDDWEGPDLALVDLAEEESLNSFRLTNALLGEATEEQSEATSLTDELSSLSSDLDDRWRGALFALNPQNPDAARHFCTSAREVIVQVLDLHAPDAEVKTARPGCEMKNGQVARREKINYLLDRYGSRQETLGDFFEEDINDVMGLFSQFNKGTHGTAGRFDISSLRALKVRVEGAIRFLSTLIRGAQES